MKCTQSKWVNCCLVFGLVLLFNAPSRAQIELSEIDKDLYLISNLEWNVNVVFLVTPKGVLLVDAGNHVEEGRLIVEKIREKTDQPIRYVALTHYHGDHSLGLYGFPENVEIIASSKCDHNLQSLGKDGLKSLSAEIEKLEKEIKDKKTPERADAMRQRIENLEKLQSAVDNKGFLSASLAFEKKLYVGLGGEKVEIIYPGNAHTGGNALVYFPEKKVMVMGDMLFNGSHPYIDFKAGSDTKNWIAWLKKLSAWQIEHVIPGHGKPGGKEILKKQITYLEVLRSEVLSAMRKFKSLEQVKKNVKMTAFKDYGFQSILPYAVEAVYQELKRK